MAIINAVTNTIQNLNNMGSLNSAANLDTLFGGIANGDEIFFPSGTYVFPEDYSFDFGDKPIYFRGQSREKTIFTTFSVSETPQYSMRCPPRVDMTKPRPQEDGFYQIDTIGEVVNSAYSGLSNPQIGDYIELTGGMPDAVARTLEDVKNANYVTYVDTTATLPAYDGLYIVDKVEDQITGGYPYTPISAGGLTLHVIIGSILEYDSKLENSWSVYVPTIAFSSRSHIHIQSIGFIDFKPFIYNPYGINSERDLLIKDCDFRFCNRVSAFEISGNNTDTWMPHPMKAGSNTELTSVPTQLYGFKSMQYINNSFSYIHQSIVWGMPSAHNILIKDNRCYENFSMLAYFVLIAGTAGATPVRRCFDYTIENNSMLACRLDAYKLDDSENQTILFQFYDETKFLNNTFIDCYGIHCYISGEDTLVDGNTMIPYINYDVDVGQNLFQYKNQGADSQPRHIFSNNLVDGCAVGCVASRQTGRVLATGNNIRISWSANFVYDNTISITRRLFYFVIDEARFRELAGSNYVISTEGYYDGKRAYWDARQNLWLVVPTGGNKIAPAFEIGVSDGGSVGTLIDAGYEIIGNSVHADIVLQVSRAIFISEISGNNLTGLNQFIRITRFGDSQTPCIKSLIIQNNPLIELINGTDTDFIVLNDLIIDNNTILNTHLSHLRIASQIGNITISNNFFGSKRDFLEDATPTRGNILQPSTPGDINIKGNTFNADHLNQFVTSIEQGKNVFISDNIAVINTPNTTVGSKTFVGNISATLLKKMEITNNSITLIDEGTDPLYILQSVGGYTGDLLTISNNNADGPGDIILLDPPNNIIFDQFRMKNNSWVVNIQYRDNFPITPPIPDEIITPGIYEVYVILNTSIPVTNSLTVTLPSSFLQDGQEVTISASDAGFSDLTINGGTIVGNPSSLSGGSSVKFKYRIDDDTWYLV